MATTLNLTTSYCGEAATELINKMFWRAWTVGHGNVTIKDDVNKTYHIRRLTATDIIATPTCDFTPAGTVDIDERDLTVEPFEVNLQMCKGDFKHVDWSSERMGTGMGRHLSKDVVDAMIEEIIGHVGDEVEYLMWIGDTLAGTYNLIDGYIKIMTADVPAGNQLAPSAVDATTVVADLGGAYSLAAGQPWFKAKDLMFWCANNVIAAYKQALANQGYMDQYQVGDKPMNYVGIPMVEAPGMDANQFVLSHKSNLYFGTESVSNYNEVAVQDMANIDLSDNVRYRSYAVAGVQIGWPEEIILHLST
jgi:hypothetical protein